MKSIYEYKNYVVLMKDLIANQPNKGRGAQSSLAKQLDCQQAYLSKVLSGNAHLNADQGYGACRYFGLNSVETDYFVTLLLLNRSYKTEAKSFWQKKLDTIMRENHKLEKRFEKSASITLDDQATYYSDWTYAAIHVLTSIDAFKTEHQISSRLKLDLQRTRKILNFLEKLNLVIKKGENYTIGKNSIHVGNDSSFSANHHRNWRLKAINNFNSSPEDLHYSSVITIDQADRYKVKEILIKAIEEIRTVVKESKENSIFSYSLDFWEL
ncbi:MAG: TIGR02147 family protein [Bdellovibrionota bacterium]